MQQPGQQSYLLRCDANQCMNAPASFAKQGMRGALPRPEKNQPICGQIAGACFFYEARFCFAYEASFRCFIPILLFFLS